MNTAKCIFIFCRYIRGHNAITGHRNNYKLENVLRSLSLVTAMYPGERISFRCFIFSKTLHHTGHTNTRTSLALARLLTHMDSISLKFLSLLFLQVLAL
jgi:hypothetical protein